MTNDALAFVGRISANQAPVSLQEVQAIAGIATTIGVLIALYIAAIREPREGCRRTQTPRSTDRCTAPRRTGSYRGSGAKSAALVRQNTDVRRNVVDSKDRQRK